MKIAAIIPARFGSTRFVGKPLSIIDKKPMIQHVYERTERCPLLDRVIVATDHESILKTVRDFGGEAIMTSSNHKSGTDRVAEVAEGIDTDVVVNIQGDEPLLEPEMIEIGLTPILESQGVYASTLATRILDDGEIFSPDVVKVVFNSQGDALYFSRSPIPYRRHKDAHHYYKHIGMYFYKKDFLLTISRLEPTRLEITEGLEQLRILEYGYNIKVAVTTYNTIGVDTPDDIKRVEDLMKKMADGAC